MLSKRYVATLIVTALMCAGCGFQLAGSLGDMQVPSPLYIAADDRYSPFFRGIVRRLRAHGVDLTDQRSAAVSVLTVRRDDTGQRVLSLSAQNAPREFEVFYVVSYDLTVNGEVTAVANDVTLARDYTWNETQVLGKDREEAIIREALVELLIDDLVSRAAGLN
ncbi:MAG: LPS assembly lipoprotein LptE [Pseudomonadota bacterium]